MSPEAEQAGTLYVRTASAEGCAQAACSLLRALGAGAGLQGRVAEPLTLREKSRGVLCRLWPVWVVCGQGALARCWEL